MLFNICQLQSSKHPRWKMLHFYVFLRQALKVCPAFSYKFFNLPAAVRQCSNSPLLTIFEFSFCALLLCFLALFFRHKHPGSLSRCSILPHYSVHNLFYMITFNKTAAIFFKSIQISTTERCSYFSNRGHINEDTLICSFYQALGKEVHLNSILGLPHSWCLSPLFNQQIVEYFDRYVEVPQEFVQHVPPWRQPRPNIREARRQRNLGVGRHGCFFLSHQVL